MKITAQQILESAPLRFRPEKAQTLNTIFHFDISGDENFQYTLTIKAGTCSLTKTFEGTANCLVKTSAKVYVDLETGKANPQMALMMGRVKVSNIAEMMQFAKCFRKFDEKYLQRTEVREQKSEINTIREPRKGPLAGVRIIDFTRLLPGPLATMFLADMGAEIIKIEDPDSPDYVRDFEPQINGTSAFYYALNRNKKSLAINFLSAEGKSLIYDLVKTADVLMEQYRPGVMKNFGFDYETLKAINPKLIYVSITGYGQTSSMAQAAGHDLNYISIAGMLGITGNEKDEPIIPGFQMADIAGGSYMAMNAVTAALYQREKTGKGDFVDVAMTDCVLPFAALPFAEYQASKNRQKRGQFQLSGGLANYNVYKCSDGKFVAVGSLEPKFWNKVCARLGKPEWSEKIMGDAAIQAEIKKEVAELFLQKTRDEWVAFFAQDDICITKINEIDELRNDSYLNERGLFTDFEVEGTTVSTIQQPLKFKSLPESANWVAPKLGEDTASILKSLNFSEEKISDLITKNVIKTH